MKLQHLTKSGVVIKHTKCCRFWHLPSKQQIPSLQHIMLSNILKFKL
jgi:hypothetical protein